MNGKYFVIENFPTDVYTAVGRIIAAAQNWEKDFKELVTQHGIRIKKVSSSSLNKLNEALKKENKIEQKDFDNLRKVIKVRNYINHTFFLEKFQNFLNMNDTYTEALEDLKTFLNASMDIIFEANDIICNLSDKLKGINIMRPTIFD